MLASVLAKAPPTKKFIGLAPQKAPAPGIFVIQGALDPVAVVVLFFVVNRVVLVIVSLSDIGVAREGERAARIQIGIGQQEIIGIVFHGLAVPIVIGVHKCRCQGMVFGKTETIGEVRDVTVAVAFQKLTFGAGQRIGPPTPTRESPLFSLLMSTLR